MWIRACFRRRIKAKRWTRINNSGRPAVAEPSLTPTERVNPAALTLVSAALSAAGRDVGNPPAGPSVSTRSACLGRGPRGCRARVRGCVPGRPHTGQAVNACMRRQRGVRRQNRPGLCGSRLRHWRSRVAPGWRMRPSPRTACLRGACRPMRGVASLAPCRRALGQRRDRRVGVAPPLDRKHRRAEGDPRRRGGRGRKGRRRRNEGGANEVLPSSASPLRLRRPLRRSRRWRWRRNGQRGGANARRGTAPGRGGHVRARHQSPRVPGPPGPLGVGGLEGQVRQEGSRPASD